MFAMSWKTILREKANEIIFTKKQQELSDDITMKYSALKSSFIKISKKLKNPLKKDRSIKICKEILVFYLKAEDLLHNLVLECFNENFMYNINQKKKIFELANKIAKFFIRFDVIKAKNFQVFTEYTQIRLNSEERFYKLVNSSEDDKISMLFKMAMPMARLFLSMFSSPIFNLEIPVFLGKFSKVHLTLEEQKKLGIFIYLCENYQWKYLIVFLMGVFDRATGKNWFLIKNEKLEDFVIYLEMMKQHQ